MCWPRRLRPRMTRGQGGRAVQPREPGRGGETDEQGQFDAEVARYMADHRVDKPAAIAGQLPRPAGLVYRHAVWEVR